MNFALKNRTVQILIIERIHFEVLHQTVDQQGDAFVRQNTVDNNLRITFVALEKVQNPLQNTFIFLRTLLRGILQSLALDVCCRLFLLFNARDTVALFFRS